MISILYASPAFLIILTGNVNPGYRLQFHFGVMVNTCKRHLLPVRYVNDIHLLHVQAKGSQMVYKTIITRQRQREVSLIRSN